jgi:hypothetical protein
MTRPWGQLHASTLTHRKYLKSSHEERSAWLTLLLWSFNNPDDDALGDRADVEATLKTLGGHRRAAVLLDRLIAIGWVDDGPCLRLHDWQSWQPEDPTGAKRKQAERARNWGEPVETVTGASRDSSVTVTQLGEERRGEENQERRGEPVSGPDAYCCLTLRFPRPGTPAYEWTTRLAEEFGLAEFNRAMSGLRVGRSIPCSPGRRPLYRETATGWTALSVTPSANATPRNVLRSDRSSTLPSAFDVARVSCLTIPSSPEAHSAPTIATSVQLVR